jgi:hypothetical protein
MVGVKIGVAIGKQNVKRTLLLILQALKCNKIQTDQTLIGISPVTIKGGN